MSGEAWFRPKRYGYGATPTNWKGWVFTLAMALALIALAEWLLRENKLAFALVIPVWFGILMTVCARKTDGGMRWRWGNANRET
jgi:hypothetical protein